MHQLDVLADNAWIAVEVAPPEVVAENHHRLRILPVRRVRGQKIAAKNRRHAKKLKRIAGEVNRVQVFREIVPCDDQIPPVHGDHVFHRAYLSQLANLWPCEARIAFVAGLADGVDLAGSIKPGIGPGVQHRAVDNAEDRNRRANPQRQRQDCGQ